MAIFELNYVGNRVMVTVASDVTLYNISDFDQRTGANVTVRNVVFEPRLVIIQNESTATGGSIEFFDLDRTNSQTAAAGAVPVLQVGFTHQALDGGGLITLNEDQLRGIRFYFDVSMLQQGPVVNTVWVGIWGVEVD